MAPFHSSFLVLFFCSSCFLFAVLPTPDRSLIKSGIISMTRMPALLGVRSSFRSPRLLMHHNVLLALVSLFDLLQTLDALSLLQLMFYVCSTVSSCLFMPPFSLLCVCFSVVFVRRGSSATSTPPPPVVSRAQRAPPSPSHTVFPRTSYGLGYAI